MSDWDPTNFQVPGEGDGVSMRSIIVMLLLLVGLLDLMAAGSKAMIGAMRDDPGAWGMYSLMLTLIGVGHFALARGVWQRSGWVPLMSALLTLLVIAFTVLRYTQDTAVDLVLASIFVLAMGANLGVLAWAFAPENRSRFVPPVDSDRGEQGG